MAELSNGIILKGLDIYKGNLSFFISLSLLALIASAVFSVSTLRGASGVGQALKSSVLCIVLIYIFPELLTYIVKLPHNIQVLGIEQKEVFNGILAKNLIEFGVLEKAHYFYSFCYWLSYYMYSGLVFLFLVTGPFVFIFGFFMEMISLVKFFFLGLILVSLWPVGWAALNYLASEMSTDSQLINSFISVVSSFVKVIGPLVFSGIILKSTPLKTLLDKGRDLLQAGTFGVNAPLAMSKSALTGVNNLSKNTFGKSLGDIPRQASFNLQTGVEGAKTRLLKKEDPKPKATDIYPAITPKGNNTSAKSLMESRDKGSTSAVKSVGFQRRDLSGFSQITTKDIGKFNVPSSMGKEEVSKLISTQRELIRDQEPFNKKRMNRQFRKEVSKNTIKMEASRHVPSLFGK